ncbi:hypothetical protein UlMin_040949 [Ulmus minor]
MMVWEVWNVRNWLVHGPSQELSGLELASIPGFLEDLQRYRMTPICQVFDCSCASLHWSLPEHDYFRLDTDTSWSEQHGLYGVGAVLRDSHGKLIGAGSWPRLYASSVGQAELISISKGLQYAREFQVTHLCVFNDAMGAISLLGSSLLPCNEDRFLVDEVKNLGVSLDVISFKYTSHECNGVAYSLARFALSIDVPMFWSEIDSLQWLCECIQVDLSAL